MIWRTDLQPQAQHYSKTLVTLTRNVLLRGRYILSKEVERFEHNFAHYNGVRHCVGVASGTDALILSLKAIGIKTNDEVITTPFTAVPTVSAIIAAGGVPVFVDIDPATYLLDINKVKKAITRKTRAVMPVHLFSQLVDIEKLRSKLPGKIAIIEDAAQAHGGSLRGAKAGTHGDLAAYSFYPTKNLGCYGDGGAIVTNNKKYRDALILMRNYGKDTRGKIIRAGQNSRLDELQAAYLSLKLQDLDRMNAKRRSLAHIYAEELKGLPITAPAIAAGAIANYHVYAVQVQKRRDALKNYLLKSKIQTDIFYACPNHLGWYYKKLGYKNHHCPLAEQTGKHILALPMYPELTSNQMKYITQTIRSFYGKKK